MTWLSTFFDRLFIWLPRVIVIRSTHGGVKWQSSLFGSPRPPVIIELKPGLAWYWPLTSAYQLIVVARQTVDIPAMSLLTQDGVSVIVSASVVYRVNDIISAIGERNWDVDCTLGDITQFVIFQAIRTRRFDQLCGDNISCDSLLTELTETCKKEVRRFGILVERVLLKDFDRSKTYRMLGETVNLVNPLQESDQ